MYLRPKFQSDSPPHASSANIRRPALSSSFRSSLEHAMQQPMQSISSRSRSGTWSTSPSSTCLHRRRLRSIHPNSTSAELTVPVHSVGGHGGNVVLILLNSNGEGVSFLVFVVGTKQNGAKATRHFAHGRATGSELTGSGIYRFTPRRCLCDVIFRVLIKAFFQNLSKALLFETHLVRHSSVIGLVPPRSGRKFQHIASLARRSILACLLSLIPSPAD